MSLQENHRQLWADLLTAENEYFSARMRLVQRHGSLEIELRRALGVAHERGAALRLLQILDVEIRKALLPELLNLTSVGHADIGLCREVVRSMPASWLAEHIEPEMWRLLQAGGAEEFRRFAELLRELGMWPLLARLREKCAESADPEMLEIADDFK